MAASDEEMLSFLHKFKQLQHEGYYANLNFSCNYGRALVAFHADLGSGATQPMQNSNHTKSAFSHLKPSCMKRCKRRQEKHISNVAEAEKPSEMHGSNDGDIEYASMEEDTIPQTPCESIKSNFSISNASSLPPNQHVEHCYEEFLSCGVQKYFRFF